MTTTSSAGGGKRPDLAAKLNAEIDCEDLAERLGLVRPGGSSGNFRSPHHPDRAPSVSVYQPDGSGPKRWKDWSTDEGGGPVDMLMWARGLDFQDAVKELASMYGISVPAPAGAVPQQRREPTLAEWIAEKCIAAAKGDQKELLLDYLCGKEAGQRHLSLRVVEEGIKRGTIGLNTWTKPGAEPGEQGYGGLAAAFILSGSYNIGPLLLGAVAAGLASTFLIQTLHQYARVPSDASIGVVFTSLFALGVVLIKKGIQGVHFDIACVYQGTLEFTPYDVWSVMGRDVPRALVVAGGVAANQVLRATLHRFAAEAGLRLVVPPAALCGDNGAMIAWAGLERLRLGIFDDMTAPARARWPLDATRDEAGAKA